MSEHSLEKYKGWKVRVLSNPCISLYVAPQLGGRIIQMELNRYAFLFVNPSLEGRERGDRIPEYQGAWLNFGGEKIWPAPQGWGSPDLWPGPPDPVLDGGPYEALPAPGDERRRLQLISQEDPYTGLQITKDIFVPDTSAEVVINATFTNKSEKTREWSVWPVFQMNIADNEAKGRYQVICPVNPDSKFRNGYKVMHGLVNNPQNSVSDSGNMVVEYQYLVGKVGMDTNANWVAFCDKEAGKVFVASFHYQVDCRYPEETSVQIWSQGRGLIYSRGRILSFPDDPEVNPPYLEIELLSPLFTILPGFSASFEYRVSVCTIPPGESVIKKNKIGVAAMPVRADLAGGILTVTGKYGVWMEGVFQLCLENRSGNVLKNLPGLPCWEVSPFFGIDVSARIELPPAVSGEILYAALIFYDREAQYRVLVDRCEISVR